MEPVTETSYIVLGTALFMLLNSAALTVYAERRVAAFIQNRVGPNRVGPLGLFQPLADVLKLLLKEDVTPAHGFKTIHTIAPIIPVVTALMTAGDDFAWSLRSYPRGVVIQQQILAAGRAACCCPDDQL